MGNIANRMLLEWIVKRLPKKADINEGVRKYSQTPRAVLADVREN